MLGQSRGSLTLCWVADEEGLLAFSKRELRFLEYVDGRSAAGREPGACARLEKLTPALRNKRRLKVGADADIAVFDPSRVTLANILRDHDAVAHGSLDGLGRWLIVPLQGGRAI